MRPLQRYPLSVRASDKTVGLVSKPLVLQIVERIVVLRTAALQVGANEEATELIALVEICDWGRACKTEESATAVLLVKTVLRVVSVVAAQRKSPVADSVIDVQSRALPLESIEELDRPTLVKSVAARVIGRVSRPPTQVDVLLPERLGVSELFNRVVVGSWPQLVLEHVSKRVARCGPRNGRARINRECRR